MTVICHELCSFDAVWDVLLHAVADSYQRIAYGSVGAPSQELLTLLTGSFSSSANNSSVLCSAPFAKVFWLLLTTWFD